MGDTPIEIVTTHYRDVSSDHNADRIAISARIRWSAAIARATAA